MEEKATRQKITERITALEQELLELRQQLDATAPATDDTVPRHEQAASKQPAQDDLLGSLTLQTILDNIPNSVWMKDKDLRYIAVNRAFALFCGLDQADILGKTAADLWPKKVAAESSRADQRVVKHGESLSMIEQVMSDLHGLRTHKTFKTPLTNDQGEVLGTANIAHDITELKAAEQRLQHLNQLMHELQRLSSTGGWEFELSNRRTYWTDNHSRLYGYEPEEISNHLLFFLNRIVHPDDADSVRNAFRHSIRKGARVDMEYRGVCKNGDIKYFKSVIVPDVDEQQNIRRVYGVSLDITTFQQAQEAMRDAARQAEEAYRAKSEFLANMSHEIRTPLNGVLGMLQLLSHAHLGEEHDDSVQVALDSGRGLLTIINDVLNLSKLEAGKAELRERPFAPHQLAQSLERLFQFPAAQNKTKLSFEVDESVPLRLSGDKERLRQILFNLIGNAIKFTENGEIHLSMSVLPFTTQPGGQQLLVTVSDTGIGIPANKLDFVLNPFSQVDGSLTRKYQGSGLGMHIVRRTVDLMNGSMVIESNTGVGTTIYVSLPFQVAQQAEQDASDESNGHTEFIRKELKVLVVEDERINRITATRFLKKLGHRPVMAHSGAEALKKLNQEPFDIILMDIQMPDMDGLATTRIIRNAPDLKHYADVPIIALTAYAMEGDRERFMEAGMDGYLAKPVSLEELRRLIGSAIPFSDPVHPLG